MAELFVINRKNCKQLQCLSSVEWTNTLWCIHPRGELLGSNGRELTSYVPQPARVSGTQEVWGLRSHGAAPFLAPGPSDSSDANSIPERAVM